MRLRSWCFLLGIFICSSATGLRAQRGPWEIIKITENLYRTRSGAWYGLFYVTPDGILLADPISSDFAGWIKKELDQRFNRPKGTKRSKDASKFYVIE